MKKIILFLYLFLIVPLTTMCYSEYIIPGGKNIGITINPDGLIVVGFYKVGNNYIASSNFKVGDRIISIENQPVQTATEMSKVIESVVEKGYADATIKRNNKIINTRINLVKDNNMYKTGLYVKDKVSGIGTLSYIDPETKIYGALGHEIILNETNNMVEVKTGNIYDTVVNSIDRSINGNVGSKNASIEFNTGLGNIKKNTLTGIYGIYDKNLENELTIKVADFNEIELGDAKILTILKDKTIKQYDINITKIDTKNINTNKCISFEVTDEELLNVTGGIVQGMSGSPIIQNNKIVGAVTHVVVDDVTRGYAIFIRTMLEEGEK